MPAGKRGYFATGTLADGALYVRTRQGIYCFRKAD